jgi:hypothetical protein
MRRLFLICILVLGFVAASIANAQVMSNYCSIPPFVQTSTKPNVLVILDNSQSMDEDFFGNAAGSFNSTSKMVIGKKALKDVITLFRNRLRVGLASFEIGSGVSPNYIHNSPYFVSYQTKSYCPNPPPECVDWCKTGSALSAGTCSSQCQAQNAAFDVAYMDEIITANGVGSSTRNKYCELIYPKTQFMEIPTSPGIFQYYKWAYPFYDGSSQGTAYCYSPGYSTQECGGTSTGPFNSYACYYGKTTSTDDDNGYTGLFFNSGLGPTDSDVAHGYLNFGKRLSWYVLGRTWFKNSSPGDGYIHVNADDLVNSGGSDTATFTNIISKLDPKEGNEAGYMSCGSSNMDTCPYIIAAGLTPTAGTFQTAANYFQGTNSPIQYKCQNNYIVFVTDGLPSVDEYGNQNSSDALMPGVLSKISALRAATKALGSSNYSFDIKTYVLGVGLTQDDKAKLDSMAQAGGTADTGGHAYYADNQAALSDAFTKIFGDILSRASSGTAASVLASSEGSGANILQAVFFPKRPFGTKEILWSGEMQNLWYYVDPYLQNSTIREDTHHDFILNTADDYFLHFYFNDVEYQVKAKRFSETTTQVDEVTLDQITSLWATGKTLWQRDLSSYPRSIYTTINGSTFTNFTTANASTLQGYLQAANTTEAQNIINYVHGVDQSGYRSRTATIGSETHVWKLGDIINSTPRMESSVALNSYHLQAPNGYSDATYQQFVTQSSYKSRGMAFVGGNDGMLHAFNAGTLVERWSGQGATEKGKLDGTSSDFGKESWAFIPQNALPYLKYLTDPNYCHLYYVDAPTFLVDASVGTLSVGDISGNPKDVNSWRTILIGGSGLGGACACTSANCVQLPATGRGYSSYFALDVTDPANPVLLWEFSNDHLGFATSGPAIIREGAGTNNGKWFVVFASGPTGPIDTTYSQFLGKSDQNLYLFVLDLKSGALVKTVNTGITNAFSGSLYGATLDVDKGAPNSAGNYKDDVLYVGYTQCSDSTCTDGGVLRLLTKEQSDPSLWAAPSLVINGIGPVTTAVTKLQDRNKNHKLWLYFGTGRFFYKMASTLDDQSGQRRLYGVMEPCYTSLNVMDVSCSSAVSNLQDQSGESPSATLGSTYSGWYINLDISGTAERVITDPLAVFSGTVFFTTFQPSADACAMGGNTYVWATNYNSGGAPATIPGKAIIQVSTGEIKEVTLQSVFTEKGNRRTPAMIGVPPKGQGLSVLIAPRPTKRVLQIQEK